MSNSWRLRACTRSCTGGSLPARSHRRQNDDPEEKKMAATIRGTKNVAARGSIRQPPSKHIHGFHRKSHEAFGAETHAFFGRINEQPVFDTGERHEEAAVLQHTGDRGGKA